MDKSTHEVRMEQWRAIALQRQARPERQTAASWLAENGVNAKQYYYWLRQIRREAYKEMKTKSLPLAPGMGVGVNFLTNLAGGKMTLSLEEWETALEEGGYNYVYIQLITEKAKQKQQSLFESEQGIGNPLLLFHL